MEHMFFDSWDSILRTFIITILAYFSLIIMLRISGKRTLSKMNAFDFTVTVALGSTLAAVSLNKEIPLADGALALGLLVFLQYMITWLSVRFDFVKGIITSTPSLIFYKGEMIPSAMKKERITTEEIRAKARQKGFSSLSNIDAIILETTGEINIVAKINADDVGTLEIVNDFKKYSQ
jgi:uncharacterized membrane protein YcaP (DUF421 family)